MAASVIAHGFSKSVAPIPSIRRDRLHAAVKTKPAYRGDARTSDEEMAEAELGRRGCRAATNNNPAGTSTPVSEKPVAESRRPGSRHLKNPDAAASARWPHRPCGAITGAGHQPRWPGRASDLAAPLQQPATTKHRSALCRRRKRTAPARAPFVHREAAVQPVVPPLIAASTD